MLHSHELDLYDLEFEFDLDPYDLHIVTHF